MTPALPAGATDATAPAPAKPAENDPAFADSTQGPARMATSGAEGAILGGPGRPGGAPGALASARKDRADPDAAIPATRDS